MCITPRENKSFNKNPRHTRVVLVPRTTCSVKSPNTKRVRFVYYCYHAIMMDVRSDDSGNYRVKIFAKTRRLNFRRFYLFARRKTTATLLTRERRVLTGKKYTLS